MQNNSNLTLASSKVASRQPLLKALASTALRSGLLLAGLVSVGITVHADPADLDTVFSGDGKVTTAFCVPGTGAECRDVLIQSDGKIVTAGSFGGNWAIARHNVNLGSQSALAVGTTVVLCNFLANPISRAFRAEAKGQLREV